MEVGYIAIPKDLSELKVNIAPWGAADLADGIDRAREIVQEMRQGMYDSESSASSRNRDPDGIDRILRSNALEFRADTSDEEVGE